jgi:hypothetical protein
MRIPTFTYTAHQLEETLTDLKDTVIAFLHNEGKLSEEDAKDLQMNYAVLVRKPGFFKRMFAKKEDRDNITNIIVRQQNLPEGIIIE